MGVYERQRDFLLRYIEDKPCQSHKVNCRQRNYRKNYFLPVRNQAVRVCQDFFLNTLDISKSLIQYTFEKNRNISSLSVSVQDRRGKHPNRRALNTEQIDEVKAHIDSLPTVLPHYVRKRSKRKYLDSTLTIKKMYELYCENQQQYGRSCVKASAYRMIFNTSFNLSFHRPKKDTCAKCETFKNMSILSEEDQINKAQHLSDAKFAQKLKDEDRARAEGDSSFRTATFDLQSVLTTPSSNVSTLYYSRKLNVFNFTVYEQACHAKRGLCYIWDESNGKRGSCEVATCLINYILSLPSEVKTLTLYSDCCGGQNRNQFLAIGLYHALERSGLEKIEHVFLVSGHTYMEVDSMHSAIEHSKKYVDVYVPSDWYNIIRLARLAQPYIIYPLQFHDFLDIKSTHKQIKNPRIDCEGHRVRWSAVKSVTVISGEKALFLKYVYGENAHVHKVPIILKKKYTQLSTTSLYSAQLSITNNKKKDLLKLCESLVVPRYHHSYYHNLHGEDQSDRLPVQDLLESSEDSDS